MVEEHYHCREWRKKDSAREEKVLKIKICYASETEEGSKQDIVEDEHSH